jgi:hypothetical protein
MSVATVAVAVATPRLIPFLTQFLDTVAAMVVAILVVAIPVVVTLVAVTPVVAAAAANY